MGPGQGGPVRCRVELHSSRSGRRLVLGGGDCVAPLPATWRRGAIFTAMTRHLLGLHAGLRVREMGRFVCSAAPLFSVICAVTKARQIVFSMKPFNNPWKPSRRPWEDAAQGWLGVNGAHTAASVPLTPSFYSQGFITANGLEPMKLDSLKETDSPSCGR